MSENSVAEYQGHIKRVLISEEEIQAAVKATAKKIDESYDGTPILLVCILKGSFVFLADVCKAVTVPCEVGFMAAKSYYQSTESSGNVKITMDLSQEELFGSNPISRPVEVVGVVTNIADMLVMEGEATSVLDYSCDRCMREFSQEKTVTFSYVLAEELEGEEEDDFVLLEDGEVDVGDLAYTSFLLDMDTKHLCSEDCKGLCSGCGVNLNEETCRCKKQIDPRWAVLAQLLDKTE